MSRSLLLICLFSLSCAVMHTAKLNDIDATKPAGRPIDVKISELGFSAEEAVATSKMFMAKQQKKQADTVLQIWQLFHMGPSTGEPVFSDTYADGIGEELLRQCPSGNVSGLTLIRETAKYPVVSGEIIKMTGYCLQ